MTNTEVAAAYTVVPHVMELPFEPAVILVTGGMDSTARILFDHFTGEQLELTSIERAVWAARLRAMADRIE